MLGRAARKARTYAELLDALYPLAAQHPASTATRSRSSSRGPSTATTWRSSPTCWPSRSWTPRFADDDFTRNRQDALDYVTKTLRGNDDEELGKQALAAVMYDGHPYGHPSQGTVAGLDGHHPRRRPQAFYATHFTRDRLIVGVAGGYPDGFAEAFAARFAALPAKAPPLPKLPPAPGRKGNRVLIVEKDARANAISHRPSDLRSPAPIPTSTR